MIENVIFLSRQDIYNWINNLNLPNIEYSLIESDYDTLYIMVAEKYIHEQIQTIIDKETTRNKVKIEITNDVKFY